MSSDLKNANIINVPIKSPGEKIFAIYVDIYGNEFKEEFSLGEINGRRYWT